VTGERQDGRRVASWAASGPTYDTSPPPTADEALLTAGIRVEPGTTYGFFTDVTVCIGCKACEVACKQWNRLPMDDFGLKATSYDNTSQLSATTWRHVAFVEQPPDGTSLETTSLQDMSPNGRYGRWLFMSDVCKHCEDAGCLDACPTGAIVRTEFGSVLIQQDVCNGCHYCVPSCPFGVIAVSEGSEEADNRAHKCTLCYDRLKGGLEPACAKACPTDSIQFGPVTLLRERARARLSELHDRGMTSAYLYGLPGGPGATGGVGSLSCFFLLTAPPEMYNLPSAPEVPSRRVSAASLTSVATALIWGAAVIVAIRRAPGGGDVGGIR
jgi:formate dehydrogenase iron-sulfur subunit